MKIVLIHGFNVRDKGKGSVDRLEPFLLDAFPGCTIDKDSADYGWVGLFIANWFWRFTKIIDRIAEALKDADIVITHSNGAHFCMRALAKIHNPKIKIVHYSPALNKKWKFKQAFERCLVFHTRKDWIVNISKVIPFSAWGNMGKQGATTKDARVANIDCSEAIESHSGWSDDENISKIFEITNEIINYSRFEFWKRGNSK